MADRTSNPMPPVPHRHRGRTVLVGDAVHAPSNSPQGASPAIESGIEPARALRDAPGWRRSCGAGAG